MAGSARTRWGSLSPDNLAAVKGLGPPGWGGGKGREGKERRGEGREGKGRRGRREEKKEEGIGREGKGRETGGDGKGSTI